MERTSTRVLGDVIGDFVNENKLQEGLLRARVFEAWDIISVGNLNLGAYTSSKRFKDGVLTCKINSSVVRQHLQFQRESIRLMLNSALQTDAVEVIKLT